MWSAILIGCFLLEHIYATNYTDNVQCPSGLNPFEAAPGNATRRRLQHYGLASPKGHGLASPKGRHLSGEWYAQGVDGYFAVGPGNCAGGTTTNDVFMLYFGYYGSDATLDGAAYICNTEPQCQAFACGVGWGSPDCVFFFPQSVAPTLTVDNAGVSINWGGPDGGTNSYVTAPNDITNAVPPEYDWVGVCHKKGGGGGGGSTDTGGGSTDTGGESTDTGGGSTDTGGESTDTGDGALQYDGVCPSATYQYQTSDTTAQQCEDSCSAAAECKAMSFPSVSVPAQYSWTGLGDGVCMNSDDNNPPYLVNAGYSSLSDSQVDETKCRTWCEDLSECIGYTYAVYGFGEFNGRSGWKYNVCALYVDATWSDQHATLGSIVFTLQDGSNGDITSASESYNPFYIAHYAPRHCYKKELVAGTGTTNDVCVHLSDTEPARRRLAAPARRRLPENSMFDVQGQCETQFDNCVQSSNYPSSYGNSQSCTITVKQAGTVNTDGGFDTEGCCDHLTFKGVQYNGNAGPDNLSVNVGDTFTWSSDGSGAYQGFRICLTPTDTGDGSGGGTVSVTTCKGKEPLMTIQTATCSTIKGDNDVPLKISARPGEPALTDASCQEACFNVNCSGYVFVNDECTIYTAASQAAAYWPTTPQQGYCKDDSGDTPQHWLSSNEYLSNNEFWNANGNSDLAKRQFFCEWACLELSGELGSDMHGALPNKQAECIGYSYDMYNCNLYLTSQGAASCLNGGCQYSGSSGTNIVLTKYWSPGVSNVFTFGYNTGPETLPTQADDCILKTIPPVITPFANIDVEGMVHVGSGNCKNAAGNFLPLYRATGMSEPDCETTCLSDPDCNGYTWTASDYNGDQACGLYYSTHSDSSKVVDGNSFYRYGYTGSSYDGDIVSSDTGAGSYYYYIYQNNDCYGKGQVSVTPYVYEIRPSSFDSQTCTYLGLPTIDPMDACKTQCDALDDCVFVGVQNSTCVFYMTEADSGVQVYSGTAPTDCSVVDSKVGQCSTEVTCDGDFFSYKEIGSYNSGYGNNANDHGYLYKLQEPTQTTSFTSAGHNFTLPASLDNRSDYRQLVENTCSADDMCGGYVFNVLHYDTFPIGVYVFYTQHQGAQKTIENVGVFDVHAPPAGSGYQFDYHKKRKVSDATENNNEMCILGQCNQATCCQIKSGQNICGANCWESDCDCPQRESKNEITLFGEPCNTYTCDLHHCCGGGTQSCTDVTCPAGQIYTSKVAYDGDSSVCCTNVPTCSSICGSRPVIDGRSALLDPYGGSSEANIAYCCPCPAGQYYDGSGCTQCSSDGPAGSKIGDWRIWNQDSPAGSFGSDSCVGCPSGEFRWALHSDYENNNDVETTRCHPCQPNKVYHSDSCWSDCSSFANTVPAEDWRSCVACPAETPISTGGLTCKTCDTGKYFDDTTCQECDAHKFLDTADTTDSQYGTCKNCPAGYHRMVYSSSSGPSSSPDCEACPTYTYSEGNGEMCDSYTDCTYHQYISTPATSTNDRGCTDCPAGYYQNENTRYVTDADGFGRTPGFESCKACASGKYTTTGDKNVCPNCPEGFDTNGKTGQSVCESCPTGKTGKNYYGQCQDCTDREFSQGGATECEECNHWQEPNTAKDACVNICPDNQIYPTDYFAGNVCEECPVGEFRSDKSTCTSCSNYLEYQDQTGQTSCKTCSTGLFDNAVNSACVGCSEGKYFDSNATNTNDACKSCGAGKFNAQINQIGETACDTCPTGYYQVNVGQDSCSQCGSNTYNDGEGASNSNACITCPANSASAASAATSVDTCECVENYYGAAGSCTECPWGSSSNANSELLSDCKCSADKYHPSGCETELMSLPLIAESECSNKGNCKDKDGNHIVTSNLIESECITKGMCRPTGIITTNYTCTQCEQATCESQGTCQGQGLLLGTLFAISEESCESQGTCQRSSSYFYYQNVFNLYTDKASCEDRGLCVEYMQQPQIKTATECGTPYDYSWNQYRHFYRFVWRTNVWKPDTWTANTFYPASVDYCKDCPANSQQPDEHQSSCLCDSGYYMDDITCKLCPANSESTTVGATNISTCQCSKGFYGTNGVCQTCGNAATTDGIGSTDSSACKCASGYSGTDGNCVKCKADEYQDQNGQTTCKACPLGTFATIEGATDIAQCTETCNDGQSFDASSSQCNTCDRGDYSNSETSHQCTACPIGYFARVINFQTNAISYTSCTSCDAGKTTVNNGTWAQNQNTYNSDGYKTGTVYVTGCSDCDAGTFSTGQGGACQNCPVGTFASLGATECQNCSAGFTSDAGSAACVACAAGKVSTGQGGACQTCPANHYTTGNGDPECEKCPAGKQTSGDGICVDCPAGEISVSGQNCTACLGGTYTPAGGDCAACALGQYSVAVPLMGPGPNTTVRTKNDAELVIEGWTGSTTSFTAAKAGGAAYGRSRLGLRGYSVTSGSYKSYVRVYDRKSGGSNQVYNLGDYKQQWSRCRDKCMYKGPIVPTAGNYQWADNGANPLTSYGFSIGGTGTDSGRCYCEQDRDPGASNWAKTCCTSESTGYFAYSFNHLNNGNDALPDSIKKETVEQIKCAGTGRYYYNRGASRVDEFTGTQYPIGSQYGFKECVEAVRNHATYGRDGKNKAVGAYLAGYGYATCYAITGDMTEPTDSTSGTMLACKFDIETSMVNAVQIGEQSPETCTVCPAGRYEDIGAATQCQACPVGTFLNATGSQSVDDCQACPAGKYNDATGSALCQDCSAGTFLNATGSQTADDCQDCLAGKFADASGSALCQDCLAGKFADASGSALCQNCTAGKFAENKGQEECDDCPIHHAQPDTGKNFCQICSGTQSQPSTGQTACIDCAADEMSFYDGTVSVCKNMCSAGAYVDSENCPTCPLGQFADVQHTATSCKTCAPGTVSKNDRTGCDACAAGKFYNSSTLACVECPADQYQDEVGQLECKNAPANVFGMNDVHDDKTRVCPYTTTHYRDGSGCRACDELGQGYICQKRMPTDTETKTERNKVIHSVVCVGDFKLADKVCSEDECVDGYYFEDEHCHSCADAKDDYEAMTCDDDNRVTLKQLIDDQCD